MRRLPLAVLAFVTFAPGAMASDAERRAREELERQLGEMVSIPKARVAIVFQAIDEPQMKLQSIELLLDGRPLVVGSLERLNEEGEHRIYAAEIAEGRHELITRVAYSDESPMILSEHAGFVWKVSSAARFETRDGLEVVVRALPERVRGERDVKKQVRVKHTMDVQMLATVDPTMPPPLRPKVAQVQDAGAPPETAPAAAEPEQQAAPEPPELDEQASAPIAQAPSERERRTKRTKSGGTVKPASAIRERGTPPEEPSREVEPLEQPSEPADTTPIVAAVPPAPAEPPMSAPQDEGVAKSGAKEPPVPLAVYLGGMGLLLALLVGVILRRR